MGSWEGDASPATRGRDGAQCVVYMEKVWVWIASGCVAQRLQQKVKAIFLFSSTFFLEIVNFHLFFK